MADSNEIIVHDFENGERIYGSGLPLYSECEPTRYARADLVPHWLPMETAPEFEDVLVSVSDTVSIGYSKGNIGWFCSTSGKRYHGSPDGWQPLPSPAAKLEDAK